MLSLALQVELLKTEHDCDPSFRLREKPRRPWLIWLLDVLKQACSGAAGHTVGMLVAILAHQASHGASECGWYFVVSELHLILF